MLPRASFARERLKDGELLDDNSSSIGVSTSSWIIGSFPLLWQLDAQLDRYLVHLFQDRNFSLSGPATGHSLAASVRHGLAAPSSVLLAPLVSSPCPDTNGGIDLLAISSSEGLTL